MGIAAFPQYIGVLNITPDSFSDGGKFVELNQALSRARELRKDGADYVEIGGESTRPGSLPVTQEEELHRILPVVEALAAEIPLAIDTFRAKTARECLLRGAKLISDVSGLRFDPQMASVIAEFKVPVVIMHSKEKGDSPYASHGRKEYRECIDEIVSFLKERVSFALNSGIANEQIIFDPGMGRFLSHDPKYSWEVLQKLPSIVASLTPHPILIGLSRKGFLLAESEMKDEVLAYTEKLFPALGEHSIDILSAQVSGYAWSQGASYLRTHEVAVLKRYVSTFSRSLGSSARP